MAFRPLMESFWHVILLPYFKVNVKILTILTSIIGSVLNITPTPHVNDFYLFF